MTRPFRIFTNSTKLDLEAERNAVIGALDKKWDEFQSVAMERWVSSDEEPKEASFKRLAR